MRTIATLCSAMILAATIAACSSERTVVRKESVQTVPAPIVEHRTTVIEDD